MLAFPPTLAAHTSRAPASKAPALPHTYVTLQYTLAILSYANRCARSLTQRGMSGMLWVFQLTAQCEGNHGRMTLYRAHDLRNIRLAWLALAVFVVYLAVVMTHLIAVANTPAPGLNVI
jgi:hypothetical protein